MCVYRYGFRNNPHLWLSVKPRVGAREVNVSHITDWIEKKLAIEFQVSNQGAPLWYFSKTTQSGSVTNQSWLVACPTLGTCDKYPNWGCSPDMLWVVRLNSQPY